MHEMSYVLRFVNLALKRAGENGAVRVHSLTVNVGEITDIVPEYLYRYYPEAVKGTIMEESELRVRVVPVRIRCAGCGKDYHPDRSHSYACPDCGQCEGEILAGKGMSISEITMETGDGPQADLL